MRASLRAAELSVRSTPRASASEGAGRVVHSRVSDCLPHIDHSGCQLNVRFDCKIT
jgi:hypothetical protein